MDITSVDAKAVQQLLNTDLIHATRLADLLQQEKKSLENRNTDALKKIVESKLLLLQEMERNEIQRRGLIQHCTGNEATTDNTTNWPALLEKIDTLSHEITLGKTWDSIKEKLTECEELSDVNSKVVSRTQKSVGRLLNILRGQNQPTETYSKKGHTQNTGPSRSLAQA